MPELWFEVYCGICGKGTCYDTEVKDQTLTVTCSGCKKEIEKLKEEVKKLVEREKRRKARLAKKK